MMVFSNVSPLDRKHSLLRALSYLLDNVPQQVVLEELPKVMNTSG